MNVIPDLTWKFSGSLVAVDEHFCCFSSYHEHLDSVVLIKTAVTKELKQSEVVFSSYAISF